MSKSYKVGQKVEYRQGSKWLSGVVHGVRSYENPATNEQTALSYLIDTGKDERVDEVRYDERSVEINKRVVAELEKKDVSELNIEERQEAAAEVVDKVLASKSLPKTNVVTEHVRQPQLVEVEASDIR